MTGLLLMTETAQNLNILERKSLILSFFLHVMIFGGIIVTFPVKDVAHKPLFIFLGSILERSDFPRIPPKSPSLGEIKIEPKNVTIASRSNQQSQLLPSRKPSYSQTISPDPKELTKSNFLEKSSKETPRKVLLEDPHLEKNIFDYRPLSLQGRR